MRVYFSAASVWEAEIKAAAGKLVMQEDLLEALEADGFIELAMTAGHARDAARLPALHRPVATAVKNRHASPRRGASRRVAQARMGSAGRLAGPASYSSSTIRRARKSKIASTSRATNSRRASSPARPNASA